jgi:glucose/arabinose dehydrogenase
VSPSAGGTVEAVQGGIRESQGSSAWRPLAAAAVLAALTALALSAASGSARAGSVALYELDQVATFDAPVYADDDGVHPNLLFVVEQAGRIRVVRNGQKLDRPFLDIREKVQFGGEQGLLSVAFDPDYDDNRRFYVYYVNNGGDIRIDGFRARSGKPARAAAGSGKRVIKVDHDQAGNHNGGQLQFGPDGHLYAGTGDGGPQMDPENDAQDPASLLGKILRLDPLPGGGYDIPNDNPYVGEDGANEIFALGLRNPWRFSFDSVTGALTIGDVGGTDWEEIDYVASPGGGEPGGLGANFGWNDFEGTHLTDFGDPPLASPHTAPIAEFSHESPDNFCAIVGGYVVHDPELTSLQNEYIYSDLCNNSLQTVQVPTGAAGEDLGFDANGIVSFGEGWDGQIYTVSQNGPVSAIEPIT